MDMPVLLGGFEGKSSELWEKEGDDLVETWGTMSEDTRYHILRTNAELTERDAKVLQHEPLAEIRHKLADSPNALYLVLGSVSFYSRSHTQKVEAFTISRMPRTFRRSLRAQTAKKWPMWAQLRGKPW